MSENLEKRFTVISNENINDIEHKSKQAERERYQTNPMYERLLNFREVQKKKKFTVEDLLKW